MLSIPAMTVASSLRVSIIMPCRNEAGHIGTILRGILAQLEPPGGGGMEVIVADGLSDDGTRDEIVAVAASDPRVRLIDNPGRIVSTGLNTAILAARGEIIIRMDAHTEYAPDYVRNCIEILDETGADNVGGPWVARGDCYLSRAIAAAFRSPFAVGNAAGHDPDYEGLLDTVYLGCWRKDLFIRIGLFDEELVRNQDDEFNLRLLRAGGRVWQSPRIKSWYRPRSSLKTLFTQYQQYGYWKVRVIRKHGRPAAARHLVPVIFVLGAALGGPLALLHGAVAMAYLGGWSFYLAASLVFAFRAARIEGWGLLPVLPLVFLTFHLGYGIGFARGIWDFGVAHRETRTAMSNLTRPVTRKGPR